jgi:hypothetical protein
MANTTITAKITTVAFGNIHIEGLLKVPVVGNKPEFFVAVSQISKLFQFDKNQASRDFKALLGEGFQFDKAKTELNPKAVNIISLDSFALLVFELSVKGNEFAQALNRLSIAYSFQDRFRDAFDIKFTEEERHAWWIVRTESKDLFWELSGEIQIWMAGRTCSAPPYTYYSNAFDTINRGLFGKPAKQIKEELGIPKDALNRDHFNRSALQLITHTQRQAAGKLRKNPTLRPHEAVRLAIASFEDDIDLPIEYGNKLN